MRPSGAENEEAPLIDKQEGGGLGYFLYEGGTVSDRPEGSAAAEQEHVHADDPLPAHAWSHVALTFTGNRTYLYVNGELVDNGGAEPVVTSEGELEIGGSTDTGEYFDGRIDEVRIYDRGLDAAEVGADMETPIKTPRKGPVAAWSFEEGKGTTVEDLTGDGHTGTIEGAEWARGKYGEGLKFDGEDDVVKISSSPAFDLTEGFSAEAWVRPESESNDWAPILAREIGGGKATEELAWWLYEGGSESNVPFGGTEPASSERDEAQAEDPLPIDAWSHVAVTYDGAQLRLYVNGELVASSPVPAGAPPVTVGELQIGAATELGDYFKGRIDEVRIYNRVISPAELDPRWIPDTTPPEISLSGSLTEGLKAGTSEYGLHVTAVDGTPARRGSGVETITISVDGEPIETYTRTCPQTNCKLEESWTFDTSVYGLSPHEVVVSAADQAGNSGSQYLPVAAPNGSIPACSTTGEVASPPDEVEPLAGGGDVKIYHGGEGEVFEYLVPPEGFDPKEASDEELERYGFPPRPSIGEPLAREAWEETVGRATKPAATGGCMEVASPANAPEIPGESGPTTRYSLTHGGWAVSSSNATKFGGARAGFLQPELASPEPGASKLSPACPKNGVLSAWVGIGGPSGAFFQAGTNAPWTFAHDKTHKVAAFTEFFRAGNPGLPSEQPHHHNLLISPGNGILMESVWLPKEEAMRNWVENVHNGEYMPAEKVRKVRGRVYDGSDTFFEIERNKFKENGKVVIDELQNFGTLTFIESSAWVNGESAWKKISGLEGRERDVMQKTDEHEQPVGQRLANTGSLQAGDKFTMTWEHCHP